MKWHKPLYMGTMAKKNKYKIIRKIKSRKFMPCACFICLALNENELLEIYPVSALMAERFPIDKLVILGIAAYDEEAFELVRVIIDKVYRETGSVDVRKYFLG